MNEALRGFTLVEMAVVLFIIGLLIAGVLGPLETQLEVRDRRQTIDLLAQLTDALYGYALTNGRLPCPDTNGDGAPDPIFVPGDPGTAICDAAEAFLPWAELGVAPGDAWNNRFRYRVSAPKYTRPEADGLCNGNDGDDSTRHFDLCTTGAIQVLSRGDNPATNGSQEGKFSFTSASNIPAIIVSHGRNGLGATTVGGQPRALPATGDEQENTDGDTVYYTRGYSDAADACADDANEATPLCEFDDIVTWLSPTVLNERMVTAGRLP